ncbi:MAG: formate dehydrogenase accessory sulfurtransferase FdhD [Clostridia bacterium]|nr:formate dehydrogenase accessory sulfurtransferase FdhD [Clostridia bacterium]
MEEHRQQNIRTRRHSIWRYSREGLFQQESDVLISEFAATIYLNGRELVTLLCTPEYLEDLAVGFLAVEGLLAQPEDLEQVIADYQRGQIWVRSSKAPLATEPNFLKRCLTTGCGKGSAFIKLDEVKELTPLAQTLQVTPPQINSLMGELRDRSELFRATGGSHSAALCSSDTFILYREDLGRHNAVDKIIGRCWRRNINPKQYFLLTSCRISAEILLKAARMGIEIVISRAAPTSLAVNIAAQLGVTVVGFARGGSFNLYTYPERVKI